jgi:hypothetical protein
MFRVEADVLSSYSARWAYVPGTNRAQCTEVERFTTEPQKVWVNGPDGKLTQKTVSEEDGHGPIPSAPPGSLSSIHWSQPPSVFQPRKLRSSTFSRSERSVRSRCWSASRSSV